MYYPQRPRWSAAIGILACIITASGVQAETANSAQQAGQPPEEIAEMIIVAHPLSGEGLSQAADVLQGPELDNKRTTNIGATLARQPGIHSADFGNAVGRPLIHGLGGPRIKIMEDRIDTLDLSVTSADHAVSVEPFIAERIEVLKGSSALLYGSGAIGGVVDVHTGRIPHRVPEQPFNGGVESRYNHNTHGQATAAKLNGGAGDVAWHLDGTWKDADEYNIPGFAESTALRRMEAAEAAYEEAHEGEHEDEHEDEHEGEQEEEVRRRLPGSQFDASSYAGGVSVIKDWGLLGVSVSQTDADYGLPGGHGHGHDDEDDHDDDDHGDDDHGDEGDDHDDEVAGTPTLEMQQTRADLELAIKAPFASFSSFNLRLGVNDYEHQEFEPNGEIATDFTNKAWEARAELVYDSNPWGGALGAQLMQREFSALGEEAFVPPVDTVDGGLFWVTERDFKNINLETGVRLGQVKHDPQVGRSETFTTYAASLGVVVPLFANQQPASEWQLGLLADLSSRAPVAEELYANGPHLVTNAFEVGNESLDEERATSLSATLQYTGPRWSLDLTAYHNRFNNYIFQQASGAIIDDLPELRFQQDKAEFTGADAEVGVSLLRLPSNRVNSGGLRLYALFDWVQATLQVRGNDNLPRIPPRRQTIGTALNWGPVSANIEYSRVSAQRDITDFELASPAYEDLRAHMDVQFAMPDGMLNIFMHGKNLTNDDQRRHTSLIKEFAPAPGRTVEFGARYTF